jgi:hypothetical protein
MQRKEGDTMTILETLGLLSFGLMCFRVGYMIGKDIKNNRPSTNWRLFLTTK